MPLVYRLLALNPGSTSTKIAVYEDEQPILVENLLHQAEELATFPTLWEQEPFRLRAVRSCLAAHGHDPRGFHAMIGRGGLLRPLESGTYEVSDDLLRDLRAGVQGEHASNLGGALAHALASEAGVPAFIVDPVSVDEFEPLARISGLAGIERSSLLHALNIKATARKAALEFGKNLETFDAVVAHLGGGITIAALRQGRAIEVNNGIGEGPFSPERTGALPLSKFLELVFSGRYDPPTLRRFLAGKGGLVSYLGTNDTREVEQRIQRGDHHAALIYEAMAYQIAMEIGAKATVLRGRLDAIVLTGGLAHSAMLTGWIEERVSFLGKVVRYPGENELEALALGGLRVLRGEERALRYPRGNSERSVG
ncbi:MAG: butyrate kinase [Deltaproteobacteria bacterium RIFOXYA12_FULL_61_11]|nr:MAG: butyrate kinase [Deltaproteobacteria bacterium RIFOXYA12_FULL_61_11]